MSNSTTRRKHPALVAIDRDIASVTPEQLTALRAEAVKNNDKYLAASVDSARRGNRTDLLACHMCIH